MDLLQFEAELRTIMGPHTGVRPFVCDGSPLDCKVFLVGANPATAMAQDFWSFWKHGYGFNKGAWFEAYLEQRRLSGSRYPVSPTRTILEAVVHGASPVTCLETNVYAAPSRSIDELSGGDRQTDIFAFLMRAIKPAVVLAHGNDAIAVLQRLAAREHVIVIEERHLGRGWSKAAAEDLGKRLKSAIADRWQPTELVVPAATTLPRATKPFTCVDCRLPIERNTRYRSERFGKPAGEAKQRSHVACRPHDAVSRLIGEYGEDHAAELLKKQNR